MSLVVDDTYIETVRQYGKDRCDEMNEVLRHYKIIMNEVIETGIMEGETAKAIKTLIEEVELSAGTEDIKLSDFSANIDRLCVNFKERIDEEDKNLY